MESKSNANVPYIVFEGEWVLNEKHRAILKRRLIDGICYEPLAEEFDMSVRQIKRIVYKGEDVIFRHI